MKHNLTHRPLSHNVSVWLWCNSRQILGLRARRQAVQRDDWIGHLCQPVTGRTSDVAGAALFHALKNTTELVLRTEYLHVNQGEDLAPRLAFPSRRSAPPPQGALSAGVHESVLPLYEAASGPISHRARSWLLGGSECCR